MLLAAALLVVAVACGDDDEPAAADSGLRIEAAALAGPVVEDLAAAFEESTGVAVEVSLVERLQQGPLDPGEGTDVAVYQVDVVSPDSVDGDPVPFGRTYFVIITPAGNPAGVSGLDAFASSSDLDVAACGPEIPFGNLASIFLTSAGVTTASDVVSEDCAEVRRQVAAGDLDAGLLLRSDIGISGEVDVVELGGEVPEVVMSAAALGDDPDARAFVSFIESADGQRIRTERGFLP